MSRLSLVLTVLTLIVVPCGLSAGDIRLREDRKLAPADMAFREALPKTAAEAPMTMDLKRDIEIVVRHTVYPMADPDKKVQNIPRLMSQVVEVSELRIRNVFTGMDPKNTAVQDEFLTRLMTELELLAAEPDQFPITRTNAARVAARLALLSQREEVADLLVKIVVDPKQVEGAKYWALMGLKDLQSKLALKQTPPIKDAKRRGEVIAALVGFVERQPPYKPNTEDEIDGLRYIRREAIRALAEVREARVAGAANGHVALALCRVVGKDKLLTPEPRLDEQVEAAVGLCRLPADPQKEYQAGSAAYQIARFIPELVRKHKDARFVKEPWKAFAARLRDGLKAMDAAHPGDVVVKSVQGFGENILAEIEKGSRLVNAETLIDWLESNKKKLSQQTVYKSEENSTVTPRGAEKEEKEKEKEKEK